MSVRFVSGEASGQGSPAQILPPARGTGGGNSTTLGAGSGSHMTPATPIGGSGGGASASGNDSSSLGLSPPPPALQRRQPGHKQLHGRRSLYGRALEHVLVSDHTETAPLVPFERVTLFHPRLHKHVDGYDPGLTVLPAGWRPGRSRLCEHETEITVAIKTAGPNPVFLDFHTLITDIRGALLQTSDVAEAVCAVEILHEFLLQVESHLESLQQYLPDIFPALVHGVTHVSQQVQSAALGALALLLQQDSLDLSVYIDSILFAIVVGVRPPNEGGDGQTSRGSTERGSVGEASVASSSKGSQERFDKFISQIKTKFPRRFPAFIMACTNLPDDRVRSWAIDYLHQSWDELLHIAREDTDATVRVRTRSHLSDIMASPVWSAMSSPSQGGSPPLAPLSRPQSISTEDTIPPLQLRMTPEKVRGDEEGGSRWKGKSAIVSLAGKAGGADHLDGPHTRRTTRSPSTLARAMTLGGVGNLSSALGKSSQDSSDDTDDNTAWLPVDFATFMRRITNVLRACDDKLSLKVLRMFHSRVHPDSIPQASYVLEILHAIVPVALTRDEIVLEESLSYLSAIRHAHPQVFVKYVSTSLLGTPLGPFLAMYTNLLLNADIAQAVIPVVHGEWLERLCSCHLDDDRLAIQNVLSFVKQQYPAYFYQPLMASLKRSDVVSARTGMQILMLLLRFFSPLQLLPNELLQAVFNNTSTIGLHAFLSALLGIVRDPVFIESTIDSTDDNLQDRSRSRPAQQGVRGSAGAANGQSGARRGVGLGSSKAAGSAIGVNSTGTNNEDPAVTSSGGHQRTNSSQKGNRDLVGDMMMGDTMATAGIGRAATVRGLCASWADAITSYLAKAHARRDTIPSAVKIIVCKLLHAIANICGPRLAHWLQRVVDWAAVTPTEADTKTCALLRTAFGVLRPQVAPSSVAAELSRRVWDQPTTLRNAAVSLLSIVADRLSESQLRQLAPVVWSVFGVGSVQASTTPEVIDAAGDLLVRCGEHTPLMVKHAICQGLCHPRNDVRQRSIEQCILIWSLRTRLIPTYRDLFTTLYPAPLFTPTGIGTQYPLSSVDAITPPTALGGPLNQLDLSTPYPKEKLRAMAIMTMFGGHGPADENLSQIIALKVGKAWRRKTRDRLRSQVVQATRASLPASFHVMIIPLTSMLRTRDPALFINTLAFVRSAITDDPRTFLRYFFEQIGSQSVGIQRRVEVLRCLHVFHQQIPSLPSRYTYQMFNHILGLVVHMHRSATTPEKDYAVLVACAIPLLSRIVSNLHDFSCKLLKQFRAGFLLEPVDGYLVSHDLDKLFPPEGSSVKFITGTTEGTRSVKSSKSEHSDTGAGGAASTGGGGGSDQASSKDLHHGTTSPPVTSALMSPPKDRLVSQRAGGRGRPRTMTGMVSAMIDSTRRPSLTHDAAAAVALHTRTLAKRQRTVLFSQVVQHSGGDGNGGGGGGGGVGIAGTGGDDKGPAGMDPSPEDTPIPAQFLAGSYTSWKEGTPAYVYELIDHLKVGFATNLLGRLPLRAKAAEEEAASIYMDLRSAMIEGIVSGAIDTLGEEQRHLSALLRARQRAWLLFLRALIPRVPSSWNHVADIAVWLDATMRACGSDVCTVRMGLALMMDMIHFFPESFGTTGFLYIVPVLLSLYHRQVENQDIARGVEAVWIAANDLYGPVFVLQAGACLAPSVRDGTTGKNTLPAQAAQLMAACPPLDPGIVVDLLTATTKTEVLSASSRQGAGADGNGTDGTAPPGLAYSFAKVAGSTPGGEHHDNGEEDAHRGRNMDTLRVYDYIHPYTRDAIIQARVHNCTDVEVGNDLLESFMRVLVSVVCHGPGTPRAGVFLEALVFLLPAVVESPFDGWVRPMSALLAAFHSHKRRKTIEFSLLAWEQQCIMLSMMSHLARARHHLHGHHLPALYSMLDAILRSSSQQSHASHHAAIGQNQSQFHSHHAHNSSLWSLKSTSSDGFHRNLYNIHERIYSIEHHWLIDYCTAIASTESDEAVSTTASICAKYLIGRLDKVQSHAESQRTTRRRSQGMLTRLESQHGHPLDLAACRIVQGLAILAMSRRHAVLVANETRALCTAWAQKSRYVQVTIPCARFVDAMADLCGLVCESLSAPITADIDVTLYPPQEFQNYVSSFLLPFTVRLERPGAIHGVRAGEAHFQSIFKQALVAMDRPRRIDGMVARAPLPGVLVHLAALTLVTVLDRGQGFLGPLQQHAVRVFVVALSTSDHRASVLPAIELVCASKNVLFTSIIPYVRRLIARMEDEAAAVRSNAERVRRNSTHAVDGSGSLAVEGGRDDQSSSSNIHDNIHTLSPGEVEVLTRIRDILDDPGHTGQYARGAMTGDALTEFILSREYPGR